mmetsp:Transcript_81379/g.226647  ORF Transcript_81379/g.226647 Transcript_81379/m.226647 type:complete len:210 (-) Transcript_81379:98-727(-)
MAVPKTSPLTGGANSTHGRRPRYAQQPIRQETPARASLALHHRRARARHPLVCRRRPRPWHTLQRASMAARLPHLLEWMRPRLWWATPRASPSLPHRIAAARRTAQRQHSPRGQNSKMRVTALPRMSFPTDGANSNHGRGLRCARPPNRLEAPAFAQDHWPTRQTAPRGAGLLRLVSARAARNPASRRAEQLDNRKGERERRDVLSRAA